MNLSESAKGAELLLKELAAKVVSPWQGTVVDLCNHLVDQEDFRIWTATCRPNAHHYGDGGLIVHTSEVVRTCLEVRNLYPQHEINEAELFLSALYHDAGKMWDYERTGIISPDDPAACTEIDREFYGWQGTSHKRKIHHISRSALVWSKALDEVGVHPNFRNDYEDAVLHAILAHHGQREWGSPVAPKSRVAWLLHLCDGISARLYDADTLDGVAGK